MAAYRRRAIQDTLYDRLSFPCKLWILWLPAVQAYIPHCGVISVGKVVAYLGTTVRCCHGCSGEHAPPHLYLCWKGNTGGVLLRRRNSRDIQVGGYRRLRNWRRLYQSPKCGLTAHWRRIICKRSSSACFGPFSAIISAQHGRISSTRGATKMPKHRIFTTAFCKVYPLYVQKAERKNRTKDEVDQIIRWLTGYSQAGLEKQIKQQSDFENFFSKAPAIHPNTSLIKGVVCGVRVEEVEDPLMQRIRYLDKLIDELAKGKAMEKILR